MAETTVIRNIRIVGRSEGIAETTARLRDMTAAQGQVSVASERTSKSTLSVQGALDRVQRQMDVAYRVQQQFTSGTNTLNRAFEQGLITIQRRTELMKLLEQRTLGAARANDNLAAPKRSAFDGASQAIAQGLNPLTSQLGVAGLGLGGMAAGAAGLAAGLGGITAMTVAITKAGDEFTTYANRLKAAGVDQAAVNTRVDELTGIALRARSALAPTVDLYAGIRKSTEDLGKSQEQVARVTETVTKAFTIGGQSASTASGAILQLNQAFAAGALRGDELNSVLEGAPPLARLIAKEFGIGVGELKKFGEDGKLSAERVFDAFLKGSREIDETFGKTEITIAQASANMSTSLFALGAEMDKLMGLARGLAGAIDNVAKAAMGMAGVVRSFGDQKQLGEIQTLSANISGYEKTIQSLQGRNDAVSKNDLANEVRKLAADRAQFDKLVGERMNTMVARPETPLLNGEGMISTTRAARTFESAMEGVNKAAKETARDGMTALARATAEANDKFAERNKTVDQMRKDGVDSRQIKEFERKSQEVRDSQIRNAEAAAAEKGGGSKGAEDAFQRAIVTAQGRTRALEEEAKLAGLAGSQLEAMRLQIELETQAKKRGLDVSDAMAASIRKEVDARRDAAQAVAVGKLNADIGFERDQLGRSSGEQQIASRLRSSGLGLDSAQADAMRLNQTLGETRDLLSGAASGFLSDMRAGKTAAEALSNQVNKLVDKLLDAALNQAITGLFGGKSGGFNPLSLFGFGGGSSMNSAGVGSTVGGSSFVGGTTGWFADGGFTGRGGKYDPAGVVHRGEYVFDAAATSRIGVDVLESMRRGGTGYADGGYVATSAPYIPPAANSNAGPAKVNVQVVNKTSGEVTGTATSTTRPDGSIDTVIELMEARMADKVAHGQGSLNAAFQARQTGRQLRG